MLDDKIRIPKGLTRLDSRTRSNQMAFNKDKCESAAIRAWRANCTHAQQ